MASRRAIGIPNGGLGFVRFFQNDPISIITEQPVFVLQNGCHAMPGSKMTRLPHGRTISCADGYRAFLPAPLPPLIRWNGELATALSNPDLALRRLAGEGGRFLNPHMSIRSFDRREAVLSRPCFTGRMRMPPNSSGASRSACHEPSGARGLGEAATGEQVAETMHSLTAPDSIQTYGFRQDAGITKGSLSERKNPCPDAIGGRRPARLLTGRDRQIRECCELGHSVTGRNR